MVEIGSTKAINRIESPLFHEHELVSLLLYEMVVLIQIKA